MAPNSYDGFSWNARQRALTWLKREVRQGRRHPPNRCDACGTRHGYIMAHSEDYSEPFGQHIGQWSLCYWCHMLLHCRRRAPDAFVRYLLMLQGGQRFVNGERIQWAAVQRYLRGQGEPAREPMDVPVGDPFGPLLEQGAAAQARQLATMSHASVGLCVDKRALGYRRVFSPIPTASRSNCRT